jgi:hypothetical protein
MKVHLSNKCSRQGYDLKCRQSCNLISVCVLLYQVLIELDQSHVISNLMSMPPSMMTGKRVQQGRFSVISMVIL